MVSAAMCVSCAFGDFEQGSSRRQAEKYRSKTKTRACVAECCVAALAFSHGDHRDQHLSLGFTHARLHPWIRILIATFKHLVTITSRSDNHFAAVTSLSTYTSWLLPLLVVPSARPSTFRTCPISTTLFPHPTPLFFAKVDQLLGKELQRDAVIRQTVVTSRGLSLILPVIAAFLAPMWLEQSPQSLSPLTLRLSLHSIRCSKRH